MGVHPNYRRRGVGRLLMEWGHEKVDLFGYESFIEGSPIGRWLYEEYGYRRVMGLHVDFDKPDPSDEWSRLIHECKPPGISLLWRPPRGGMDGECASWSMGCYRDNLPIDLFFLLRAYGGTQTQDSKSSPGYKKMAKLL